MEPGGRAWRGDLVIHADLESVVAWFVDPQRAYDRRAVLERRPDVSNVVLDFIESEGVWGREIRWTRASGVAFAERVEMEMTKTGLARRTENGYEIRRRQLTTTRAPNGREIVVEVSYFLVLESDGARRTAVSATVHFHTTGAWWAKIVRRLLFRVVVRTQLRKTARRCEVDVSKPVQVSRDAGAPRVEEATDVEVPGTAASAVPGGPDTGRVRRRFGVREGLVIGAVVGLVVLAIVLSHGPKATEQASVASIRTVQVAGYARAVVLSPDGNLAYVADGSDITSVDLNTGRILKQIPLHQTPKGLAISQDGSRLYAVTDLEHNEGGGATESDSGALMTIDTSDSAIVARVNIPATLEDAVAVTNDGRLVYVADYDRIIGISTSTSKIVEKIPVPEGPQFLVVNATGTTLYGETDLGSGPGYSDESFLYVVNVASRRVVSSVPSKSLPSGLALASPGGQLVVSYVGGADAATQPSFQFMSGTGQLTATEQRGAGGTGVATSLGGHVGYVPTVQAGIVVLDLRNHKEIGTIQPGTVGLLGPGAIAISGNGRRLCLLDGGFLQPSASMQVISLSNR